jgi:hypothetical protein
MKIQRPLLFISAGFACLSILLQAEYTFFTPPGSFTVEISLENSPYARLPIYRNAITSLEVVGDYYIVSLKHIVFMQTAHRTFSSDEQPEPD